MSTQRPERRARTVALIGLGFQILLAAFFAVLAVTSHSEAVRALTLLTGLGSVVWLALSLVYHQRVLVQEETFETEQLRQDRETAVGTDAIFDVADEELLLARRRLRWMYRWLLPGSGVVLITLLLVAGLWYWSWPLGQALQSLAWGQVGHTGLLIWFVGGGALVSFWFSRYTTGLARHAEWRMLHAGSAYLMGVTLAAAALAGSLAALHFFQTPVPERAMAYALRLLLLFLAAEILLNLVLDFYRPRAPDEEPRPAFDSRLLGLFTEPGGIARSIAEAINYQFGFEVSSTWFYQLLQRSVVPLLGFAVATLVAATCLVFVNADETAVIERYGAKARELDGGLHVKWPWPIEVAYKVETGRIHEMRIGTRGKEDGQNAPPGKQLILWTNKHSDEPHLTVLVATPEFDRNFGAAERSTGAGAGVLVAATPPAGGDETDRREAVPVSLLQVSVTLQYRITDAYRWLRTYAGADDRSAEAMLATIAEQEIVRYCARAKVADLLGGDRAQIEASLLASVTQAAAARGLPAEIVFLGLQGVHPPEPTAEAFQDVIGAEFKRTATEETAQADWNKQLASVAGSETRARELASAIDRLAELESASDAPAAEVDKAQQKVNALFFGDASANVGPVGGAAAELIAEARAKRWQLANEAHGRAVGFGEEMKLAAAAPQVYRMQRYLEALAGATSGIRKYVMAVEEGTYGVKRFHLNLQDPRDIAFDEAIREGE